MGGKKTVIFCMKKIVQNVWQEKEVSLLFNVFVLWYRDHLSVILLTCLNVNYTIDREELACY